VVKKKLSLEARSLLQACRGRDGEDSMYAAIRQVKAEPGTAHELGAVPIIS
jgi:hypothetical protein